MRHEVTYADCKRSPNAISDGSVMRTCAKVGLKDCIEMEGKTYCYCKNQVRIGGSFDMMSSNQVS